MMLWVRKETEGLQEGEIMITFDPPEESDEENWNLYTTREQHYKEIAIELELQARMYKKKEDYRSMNLALNLAKELRAKFYENTNIN